MKDITDIFKKAIDIQSEYHYRTVRYALEYDPEIWCMHDPDTNKKWSFIGKTDGNYNMTEIYGYICDTYPVALLKDNCPDKVKKVLEKCKVFSTSFDEELSCEESILRYYLTDVLIIDDRFLEDESLPFDNEAFDKITDGYRYTTPYRFAFEDFLYSYPHYTKSELDGMNKH